VSNRIQSTHHHSHATCEHGDTLEYAGFLSKAVKIEPHVYDLDELSAEIITLKLVSHQKLLNIWFK
jgi:hypothetical protein